MSAASQRMTNRPAGFVALDGGHGPVVGGVFEPSVRGESALDQDEGVPAVVLGSGRREPVAEAVELLGVEREHGDAALRQGVHLRAVRSRSSVPIFLQFRSGMSRLGFRFDAPRAKPEA